MVSTRISLSIHELQPLNLGGVIARTGFEFQDHVAVGFCLEMLINKNLIEVWCETQDDVTLIWQDNGVQRVEFVQVKAMALGHFWSVAELCKQEKNLNGQIKNRSSILEKSLAQDRCKEKCQFRVVTSLNVNDELNILLQPLSSPLRENLVRSDKLNKLISKIEQYLPDIKSENDHGVSDWVSSTVWSVEHSFEAVKYKNLSQLAKLIEQMGYNLSYELIERQVYPFLLQKVKDASLAEWAIQPKNKKICRQDFLKWFTEQIDNIAHSVSVAGDTMQEKMEKVNIPADYIISAHDERRKYRQESIEPQYLELSDRELVEGEISVALQHLRLDLDMGKYEQGLFFYKVCLDKLCELQSSLRTKAESPLFYLHGCMHDITDRCGHRYHRETT